MEFLLRLCGAAPAAIVARSQTKKHQVLIIAYSLAANELASVRARLGWQLTEASWEAFFRDRAGDLPRAFAVEVVSSVADVDASSPGGG
jgi:SMODS and SLOG-associating 2TM effector domain 1